VLLVIPRKYFNFTTSSMDLSLSKDTEIRKMRLDLLNQLCRLLDSELSLFMGSIVVDLDNPNSNPKFTSNDVDQIKIYAEQNRSSPIRVLLVNEWGTMGKKRPTLKNLLELLVKCHLYRAADYLANRRAVSTASNRRTGCTCRHLSKRRSRRSTQRDGLPLQLDG
jgi:Tube Death domain